MKSDNYYKLLEKIESEDFWKDKKFKFEYNGHYQFDLTFFKSELRFSFFNLSEEHLALLLVGQKFPERVIITPTMMRCGYCGEYIKVDFDGENFTITNPCAIPGGIKELKVELNVPSGKMVFANDLRRWFRVQGDFDVNTDLGIVQTMKAYEKVGMAHGFVGNSCPGIYRVSSQFLSISGPAIEDDWDGEKLVPRTDEQIAKQTPPGKKVGGICTDLWWYSVVDYQDFETRFLDMGGTKKQFKEYIKDRCHVIDVQPGVYNFTHHFVSRYDELEDQPLHYANIIWNREPEKRELYQQYKQLNYTIGQCFMVAIKNYPSLYCFTNEELPKSLSHQERMAKLLTFSPERLEHSFARFLDHTFVVGGSGTDWHENGWGSSNLVDPETPDFPMPILTQKYSWYPMSIEYATLCLGANNKKSIRGEQIKFNDSFLAGAYNVLHCMLRYGAETSDTRTSKEVDPVAYEKGTLFWNKQNKKQKKLAKQCLRSLDKRYPGTLPEYCKDLM